MAIRLKRLGDADLTIRLKRLGDADLAIRLKPNEVTVTRMIKPCVTDIQ